MNKVRDDTLITDSISSYYLNLAIRHFPVIHHIISQHGALPLSEYVQTFVPVRGSYQKRDDLYDEMIRQLEPLLGKDAALRSAQDVEAYPVVLTMNHHGVDYCVSSIAGSMIYSLTAVCGLTPCSTIPVFSFGNVPLNNFTYPRGILLYQGNTDDLESIPQKLPLFPDRLKNSMVSAAPPIDRTMITAAESRLTKLVKEKCIPSEVELIIRRIWDEDYGFAAVQPSYSHQSVLINNRIWKRLFREVSTIPDLLYIEIEKITAGLLEYDLLNSDSLAWHILFNPVVREKVLIHLDAVSGCWHRDILEKRLTGKRSDRTSDKSGTVFFWGIDSSGKRIPLFLQIDRSHPMLVGRDDRGTGWEVEFSPRSLIDGLKSHRLLPSLFTCFMVISFARGVSCIGGYYQCEYLPTMQTGVVLALKEGGLSNIADSVAQIPTTYYLCGMLTILQRIGNNMLIPAGPVEIIQKGGIHPHHLQQIKSLSVKDAHIAGLFDTILDVIPIQDRLPAWKQRLAEDIFQVLSQKVVII